jgi:hypothetical protein
VLYSEILFQQTNIFVDEMNGLLTERTVENRKEDKLNQRLKNRGAT